jgi:integrase
MTILNAIATDRFTSPRACVKHSYYAQFLNLLFLTGVRPQLAIALEWEQIIWGPAYQVPLGFSNLVRAIATAKTRHGFFRLTLNWQT